MSFLAALGAGVASAVIGSKSESRRRRAIAAGRDRGNEALEEGYVDVQNINQPWSESGHGARRRLDQASEGDYSGFKKSLDYDFRRSEGQRDVGNVFSVKGGGGNAMKALTEFNQNLAGSEYGNWWNRQSGIADRGFNADTNTATAAQNRASGVSRNEMIAGGGIGASHANQGAIMNNAMTSTVGNYLYGKQRGYWGGGGDELDYVGVPTYARRPVSNS